MPGTATERELKLTDRDMAALRVFSVSPTLHKLREAVLETREVSESSWLLLLLSVRKAGLGPRAEEGSFYCLESWVCLAALPPSLNLPHSSGEGQGRTWRCVPALGRGFVLRLPLPLPHAQPRDVKHGLSWAESCNSTGLIPIPSRLLHSSPPA